MGPAQRIVAPTFNEAQSGIQAQIPALQNLYTSLMQGLQAQAGQQVQNVNQSAMQRGVFQQTTPMSTQDMLNQALMQSGAQMNVQRAQDVAGLRGQVGVSNVNRGMATVDQKGATEQVGLAAQENALRMQELQRDYNIREAQFQKAQAEAAARAAASAATRRASAAEKAPMLQQRKDGGFEFRNYFGETISAAQFAKEAKVPLNSLLKEMAMAGDKGAADVLKRGSKSPFYDDITYTGRWDAAKRGWR